MNQALWLLGNLFPNQLHHYCQPDQTQRLIVQHPHHFDLLREKRMNVTSWNDDGSNKKRVGFVAEVVAEDDGNRGPNLRTFVRDGTPHPHKKQKNVDGETEESVVPPQPAFSETGSTVMDGNPSGLDSHEEQRSHEWINDSAEFYDPVEHGEKEGDGDQGQEEEDQEPSEEEKQWEAFCESKQGEGDPLFECFVQGRERWKTAAGTLENSLQNGIAGMETLCRNTIQDLIMPIFNVQREKVAALKEDCKQRLIANHEKRMALSMELDLAEKKMSSKIRTLRALTMGIREPENNIPGCGTPSPPDKSHAIDRMYEQTEQVLFDDILNDSNSANVETAKCFFDASQKLQDAEERFLEALRQIEVQWQDSIFSVADLLEQIHLDQHHKYEDVEPGLRFKIMETDARQKEFASKVQEAQERKTAYFASLMGMVKQKTSSLLGFR